MARGAWRLTKPWQTPNTEKYSAKPYTEAADSYDPPQFIQSKSLDEANLQVTPRPKLAFTDRVSCGDRTSGRRAFRKPAKACCQARWRYRKCDC